MGVVSWMETDASGRFHFTAPWRWVEDAEHALYRAALADVDVGRFPRRATEAVYHRPLVAGDAYAVELGLERIGASSIRYGWRVVSDGVVCVEGAHTVVHVGQAGLPVAVPDAIRTTLSNRLSDGATVRCRPTSGSRDRN